MGSSRLSVGLHALLSARAIEADRCRLVGWIANRIDAGMAFAAANIDALCARIEAPLLGVLDHAPEGMSTQFAPALDVRAL